MGSAAMRALIANDPAGPEALRVTPGMLERALARGGDAARSWSIELADDAAALDSGLRRFDPQALLACLAMDFARAGTLAPSLSWVQVTTAGVEKHLSRLPPGMILTNASGVHAEKGAEFILAAALMLVYDIPRFVTDKERRNWAPAYGGPLRGRTVTLLGLGAIGTAAARLLKPFGARLVGVARRARPDEAVERVVTPDALDEALAETDILVSTLPLTAATERLVDRRRIGLLREGAGIVVVGRARVFDYEAMMDRLESGTLGGAVLDVYPVEPVPQQDRLWTCPRLVMTPHCSVDDHGLYAERCLDLFIDNLHRRAGGMPLVNVVDRDSGY